MEKNIKDYLHLYLDCDIRMFDKATGEWSEFKKLTTNVLNEICMYDGGVNFKYQLSLRPLSDMTEEEGKQYVSLGFGGLPVMKDEQRIIYTTFTPPCLNWLRKMGFDCDELIESGLAIDKTKLNKPI